MAIGSRQDAIERVGIALSAIEKSGQASSGSSPWQEHQPALHRGEAISPDEPLHSGMAAAELPEMADDLTVSATAVRASTRRPPRPAALDGLSDVVQNAFDVGHDRLSPPSLDAWKLQVDSAPTDDESSPFVQARLQALSEAREIAEHLAELRQRIADLEGLVYEGEVERERIQSLMRLLEGASGGLDPGVHESAALARQVSDSLLSCRPGPQGLCL